MRHRFLAHELYEEWFEGILRRKQWDRVMLEMPYMQRFRNPMFRRLIPNLEYIGLFSPRIQSHYAQAGLIEFAGGATPPSSPRRTSSKKPAEHTP
jgi:hypothetical protein